MFLLLGDKLYRVAAYINYIGKLKKNPFKGGGTYGIRKKFPDFSSSS